MNGSTLRDQKLCRLFTTHLSGKIFNFCFHEIFVICLCVRPPASVFGFRHISNRFEPSPYHNHSLHTTFHHSAGRVNAHTRPLSYFTWVDVVCCCFTDSTFIVRICPTFECAARRICTLIRCACKASVYAYTYRDKS